MYSPCKTLEFEGLNSNLHPRTKFGNFQLGLHPQSSHGVFWSSLLLYVLLLVLLVPLKSKFWPGLPLRPWGQEFLLLFLLLLLLSQACHQDVFSCNPKMLRGGAAITISVTGQNLGSLMVLGTTHWTAVGVSTGLQTRKLFPWFTWKLWQASLLNTRKSSRLNNMNVLTFQNTGVWGP